MVISAEKNCRLGQIASVRSGFAFRSKIESDREGDVAVIQMRDLDEAGHIDLESCVRIAAPARSEKNAVRRGDVILRMRGDTCQATVAPALDMPTIVAAPLLIIQPNPEVIDPEFLCWLLKQPRTQDSLSRAATGKHVRLISKAVLDDLVVNLPPIEKQRLVSRIAALADREEELMRMISAKRRLWLGAVLNRRLRGSTSSTSEAGT